ncbi:MAG: cytochrome P450 [Rhizobiaceae bacterium]|nr:cytochrome P450 [Rhizobiaceae bacterium]
MTPGGLPFLDFQAPGFSTRSKEVLEARNNHWCAKTPFGYAVLRHREVGLLLRDKRLRQGSYAWPETNGLEGSFAEFWSRSIISTEGATHKQLRAIAMPALAPEFIESLRPVFDEISRELTSQLRQSDTCEFMEDFSIPFAGKAICALLGMDTNEWHQLSHDASDLGLAMGVDCKSHEPIFNAACDRLMMLSRELIDRARSGKDNSSYVARLVREYDASGMADEQALLDLVVISIFGGVDTTRSQLGFAMGLFVQYQEQWQILSNDLSLVPQAIEEIIRAWPTTTWSTREAMEDFEFGGVNIRAGDTLHMLVHASARDPAICDQPMFDITRKRKIHFGFGGGAHHCLGALVARTDMASALTALAKTLRSFEYSGEPKWLPDSGNTSPVHVPLRYELR